MSKFKYKLREQEEDGEEKSGLKKPKAKTELLLTSDKYNVDQLLDIINNPENLGGTFVSKSGGLADLELMVFGYPHIPANYKKNQELFDKEKEINVKNPTTGEIETKKVKKRDLYREIKNTVGGFDPKSPVDGKKIGYTFLFPEKSKYNLELVKKYYAKTSGEKAVKSSLNPVKVDDQTLKFELKDQSTLIKILNNAKLDPNKDYNLTRQKSLEEYAILKEKLNKILKNVK